MSCIRGHSTPSFITGESFLCLWIYHKMLFVYSESHTRHCHESVFVKIKLLLFYPPLKSISACISFESELWRKSQNKGQRNRLVHLGQGTRNLIPCSMYHSLADVDKDKHGFLSVCGCSLFVSLSSCGCLSVCCSVSGVFLWAFLWRYISSYLP